MNMAKLWKLPVVFNLREQRIRYGYVYGSSLRQHGWLHAWRLRPGNLGNFSPRFCNKTLTLIFVLSGGRNGRIYIYIYIFFLYKEEFFPNIYIVLQPTDGCPISTICHCRLQSITSSIVIQCSLCNPNLYGIIQQALSIPDLIKIPHEIMSCD